MILLDTNVILDLFGDEAGDHARWSRSRYAEALLAGDVGCCAVVTAELAGRAERPDALLALLADFEIVVSDLPIAAAFSAGRAFQTYRLRGGPRRTILPGFLVAGHAATTGAPLVTRDRRLASYFPDLLLITPESHP